MSKESGIIYRSFIEAIHSLPESEQLEAYNGYMEYLFEGEYTGDNPVVRALITAIRPTVDKASNRYQAAVENGKKGGRPPKPEKNQNETRVKPEKNQNETRTKPEANPYVDVYEDVYVDEDVDVDDKEKRKPAKAGKRKDQFYPQDEKLNQAFLDFIAMRKNIKKPMTDKAIQLAIKKLDGLSHGDPDIAVAILEQSILNSWQGLFALQQPRARSGTDWDALMADIERREAAAT